MESIARLAGTLFYRLRGWTFEPLPDYWENRAVVIGFPHRSNMDTFMAFACFMILKIKGHILIKAQWFFWPMSIVFKIVGGIPVDRSKQSGVVEKVTHEFHVRETFVLAIVPEGTRKKVNRIKTGFWYIAKAANVPIICWYLDQATKTTRWLGRIDPGEDMQEDLWKIHALYSKAGYEIPMG